MSKNPSEERNVIQSLDQVNLEFTHVREDLPPETKDQLLLWDLQIGWMVELSFIVRQHITHDFDNLGYSRTVKWALLPTIRSNKRRKT